MDFDLERLKPYPELYEAAIAMANYYKEGKFSEDWNEESIKEYTDLVENIYRGMMFVPDGAEVGREFYTFIKKEVLPESFVTYLKVLSNVGMRFVGSIVVPYLILSLNDIAAANLIRDLSDIRAELERLKGFNDMIKPLERIDNPMARALDLTRTSGIRTTLERVVEMDSRCNWELDMEGNRFYLSEQDKERMMERLRRDLTFKGNIIARSLAFEEKLGEARKEYNYLKKWLPKGYSIISKMWEKRDTELVEMFTKSSDILKEVCPDDVEVPTFAKFKKNGIPEENEKEWKMYQEMFGTFFEGIFQKVVVPIR